MDTWLKVVCDIDSRVGFTQGEMYRARLLEGNSVEAQTDTGWRGRLLIGKECHVAPEYENVLRAEFQTNNPAEKVEMGKFEPDWSKAPEWANYWAVDASGCAFWYEEKPKRGLSEWNCDHNRVRYERQFICDKPLCNFNWLDSLQERPNTLSEDWLESLAEALGIKEGRREPSRVTAIQTKDSINPSHYKNGKVECIDAIESATVGKTGLEAVCTANVTKYLWRYETKNGLEDVKKAQWYLNRLVEHLESKES